LDPKTALSFPKKSQKPPKSGGAFKRGILGVWETSPKLGEEGVSGAILTLIFKPHLGGFLGVYPQKIARIFLKRPPGGEKFPHPLLKEFWGDIFKTSLTTLGGKNSL